MGNPWRPNWAHFRQFSRENSPRLSRSIKPAFNSFCANWITAFLSANCSVVQEKSIYYSPFLISDEAQPCTLFGSARRVGLELQRDFICHRGHQGQRDGM